VILICDPGIQLDGSISHQSNGEKADEFRESYPDRFVWLTAFGLKVDFGG
jgi:hypothetical protein